jgi:hypothetical protein
MTDDAIRILVWGLLALAPLWLVWQFLKFAAKGVAAFKNPAVSRRVKATGIGLPAIGFLLAGAGVFSGIAWREGGMHLGILGVTLFLGGVWLMSTADRPLKRYEKIGTVVMFTIGVLVAAAGVGHALIWPQKPVVGTGSVGDVLSAGGLGGGLGGGAMAAAVGDNIAG